MSDLAQPGKTYFIADLHLAEARPLTTQRFFHFLETTANGSDALYILGDLFEYWVGDDDINNSLANDVANRLKALAASGTRVYFMHGNRDFLLAKRFAEFSGMSLLADPVVADLYGIPTLLTHGDILCTDDKQYQQFRKFTRLPLLQKLASMLPLALRHRLAGLARAGSQRAKAAKSYQIMDVNEAAVEQMFRQYAVSRMIHGHTHRPARHRTLLEGKENERWVLPDWYGDGGYLTCSKDGCELSAI